MEINRIYNESCLDTLARMPDRFVDLVVTSPPYNMRLRVSKGKYTFREKTKHMSKEYDHFDDALPIEEFYSFHKQVLSELLRVSKIVCYNFQIVTGSKEAFFRLIGDFSPYIRDIIVWDKGHGEPAMHPSVMNACHEFILVLEPEGVPGRGISNVYFERGKMENILRIPKNRKGGSGHGAVFPLELPKALISAFSPERGLVYEPFAGQGTTCVAAVELDRNFIGSELVEEFALDCETNISAAIDKMYF